MLGSKVEAQKGFLVGDELSTEKSKSLVIVEEEIHGKGTRICADEGEDEEETSRWK